MTFKKSLVATTALSAVGLLAATGAYAAEKPKLSISGYQETYMGMSFDRDGKTPVGTPTYNVSQADPGAFGIVQYGEIRFTARGTTDSGLKWGVRFEDVQDERDRTTGASANNKNSTDEAHMWVDGSWGRLEIGGQDGAADRNRSNTADMIPIDRRIAGLWTDTRGTRVRGSEDYGSINDSSDDTKLTYWTPRISGFRAAYSWVPNSGSRGSVMDDGGTFHEFGAKYRGKFSGASVEAAFAYTLEDGAAPDNDDLTAWQAGVTVGFGGFSVAAGYADKGERRATNAGEEETAWDIGVAYEQGPWMVGVAYYTTEHEVNGAADDEYNQITLFGAYNLGGGLSVAGGLYFVDLDDSSTAATDDNETVVGAVKIGARF